MAITERYVTTTGAGAHDGTSEADAFSWAEMITDINTPRVGYRYNVKQGTYSLSATTTLTGDGTTTSPNIIRGYKTTIGDATLGYTTGGVLDTSNMPTIAYNATYGLTMSGSTHLIIEALNITGDRSTTLCPMAADAIAVNCKIANSSTGANGHAIQSGGSRGKIINCEISAVGTSATFAVANSTGDLIAGCKITCTNGSGIQLGATNIRITHNTIYDVITGIDSIATNSTLMIENNTIANCSGDGIKVVTSSTISGGVIIGNHITGCGGYCINLNTPTSAYFVIAYNRYRDYTSGTVSGGGDWETALTGTLQDTGATGADSDDFVDQSTDDYSLKAGAVATSRNFGYLIDIGAHGSPVVTGGGSALHLGALGQTGIGAF